MKTERALMDIGSYQTNLIGKVVSVAMWLDNEEKTLQDCKIVTVYTVNIITGQRFCFMVQKPDGSLLEGIFSDRVIVKD